MDSRSLRLVTSSSNATFDGRPLPPLPVSDVEDVASEGRPGSEEFNCTGSEVGILKLSSQGIDQFPPSIAGPSADSSGEIEHRLVGFGTPSTRLSSQNNTQSANAEASGVAADSRRNMSANITQDGGSSTTAGIKTRLSQKPSYVLNADHKSRPARNNLPSRNSSGSDSAGESGFEVSTASRARSILQNLDSAQNTEQTHFIVPKWQPDAAVTLCPICRTQFSFFIRKHHCRKCGRVVCGSCSPHRITIPYQYIVQSPPAEKMSPAPRIRPRLDSGRTRSSLMVNNLGGGERVRLCNPCVPDPNVAPPHVPESRNNQPPPTQQGHSRSVSSTMISSQPSSSVHNPLMSSLYYTQRRPREPGILNSYNTSTSSYTERSSRLRPQDLQNRFRSSTVGTNRDTSNMGNSASTVGQWTAPVRSEQPQTSSSHPSPAPRPIINEEDECWICHQELPSRSLTDWENLRAEHVNNCLSLAMQGSSSSASPPPPALAPIPIPSQSPRTTPTTQAESSRNPRVTPAITPPIANTPEARMAARERAHAAVVLGTTSSSIPIRRTGVFPYKATEKDCIDDAECTICLEEFVVGEDMGRLECFCRFHHKCIREWFSNRPGQCPVHQHGAGY